MSGGFHLCVVIGCSDSEEQYLEVYVDHHGVARQPHCMREHCNGISVRTKAGLDEVSKVNLKLRT